MSETLSNSKNRLQEIWQKKHIALPKYHTIRSGGTDHRPLWTSTVEFADGNVLEGLQCLTKVAAESSAAEHGLSFYNYYPDDTVCRVIMDKKISDFTELPLKLPPDEKIPIINKSSTRFPIYEGDFISDTALLVDIENLPKFIDNIRSTPEDTTIYAFIGKHHPLASKNFPGAIKLLSPSTRRNGTDTYIQVYTGILLSKEAHNNYLIATRDNFGSALVEMIVSPDLGWPCKSAHLITDPSQLPIIHRG